MPTRCLDLTRSLSRIGTGAATGVDRVERAYLDAMLTRADPLFALCRTATGFCVLDRAGVAALRSRIVDEGWGALDLLARLSRRLSPERRRAEADLRRLAVGSCLRGGLKELVRRHLPDGVHYLNTGHSNLDARVMATLQRGADARIAVLVHDTIPLDYPQYQRPGTPAIFATRMQAVSAHADLVICNSKPTAADVRRHFDGFGRVPDLVVAHLGVEFAVPDAAGLPADLDLNAPYFVALSTIEPRKNHALLLDVWDRMAAAGGPLPTLFVVGRRGWNNADVFARLDACPPGVRELGNLADGAVAALVQGARALLFPSHAEGFGLPPVEAAALGTPVVCSPLPVLRELLGRSAVYLDPADTYAWSREIMWLSGHGGQDRTPRIVPTWVAHFNEVFTRF